MRIVKRLIFIAAVSLLSVRLSALDLNGCVKMAVANSHALKSADLRINSAASGYESGRRSRFPVLAVTGEDGYNRYQRDAGLRDGLAGQLGVEFSWDTKKALSGYQELSRLELEKARLLRELSEKDIVRAVTRDYYELYILLGKRADYREARDYFSSHIEDIAKLEAAGLDVKLDRVRAEIQLRSLELTARELETDIAGVLKALSSAAGAELRAEDIVYEGGSEALVRLPALDPASVAASTRSADAAGAFSARLDRLETSSVFEAYRQSKFVYAPTLQLGVSRNLDIDPATQLYRTFVLVSLDVFDFGARAEEGKSLLHDYEARKEAELEGQKQLRLELSRLTAEIDSAAVSYAGLKNNYEAAAGNLETAKLYYTKGKIKETDLLSIFSEYLEAKQQSRDALGRYFGKKAELAYLRAGAEK